ncbi:MAG TPA: hypothetical protein VMU17_05620 [Elusimicrobiota bacterium]|nr:hypothetical protein [Elusimicrobiota bacterium]
MRKQRIAGCVASLFLWPLALEASGATSRIILHNHYARGLDVVIQGLSFPGGELVYGTDGNVQPGDTWTTSHVVPPGAVDWYAYVPIAPYYPHCRRQLLDVPKEIVIDVTAGGDCSIATDKADTRKIPLDIRQGLSEPVSLGVQVCPKGHACYSAYATRALNPSGDAVVVEPIMPVGGLEAKWTASFVGLRTGQTGACSATLPQSTNYSISLMPYQPGCHF